MYASLFHEPDVSSTNTYPEAGVFQDPENSILQTPRPEIVCFRDQKVAALLLHTVGISCR